MAWHGRARVDEDWAGARRRVVLCVRFRWLMLMRLFLLVLLLVASLADCSVFIFGFGL